MAKTADDLRKMLDQDYQSQSIGERELKDQAAKILEETGYADPNKAIEDDSGYVSPFEKATDIDKIRQDEMGQPANRDPASDQGIVRDILLGKDVAAIPTLPPLQSSSQQVFTPNIPRLSDVATSQQAANVSIPKPGTTAPQITSEGEIAQNIKDTSAYLNQNIKGSEGFYNAAKTGEEAKINAEEAKALTEANLLGEQQQKLQDEIEQNAQRESAARAKADEQLKSIGQIDPNRVWNNRSIWSKMALVAGAALSGKAGSSIGLQMMQDLVSKDIESQKADMEAGIKRQGSLLELIKPYTSNKAELIKLGNNIGMKMAEKYAEAMKAKVGKDAIPMLAIERTMKEYTKPLLVEKNKADENLIKISGQEQDRRYNDEQLKQKNMELQLSKARLKFDKTNMTESDAKRLEGATAMAISAKRMRELEDDKDFDPTTIKSAIGSYMQGKGIPGSLNEKQAEYVANYSNYFSYLRQALTGAAASDKEEERIKLLVAPDKTFRKDAIKLYQRQRANAINGAVNSMNAPALERTKNIPEFAEFTVNRAEANKAKLRAKLKK